MDSAFEQISMPNPLERIVNFAFVHAKAIDQPLFKSFMKKVFFTKLFLGGFCYQKKYWWTLTNIHGFAIQTAPKTVPHFGNFNRSTLETLKMFNFNKLKCRFYKKNYLSLELSKTWPSHPAECFKDNFEFRSFYKQNGRWRKPVWKGDVLGFCLRKLLKKVFAAKTSAAFFKAFISRRGRSFWKLER